MNLKSSTSKRAVLFSLIFLVGCSASQQQAERPGPRPDGKYDNHTYLVDPSRMDLKQVMDSFVSLYNVTEFKTEDGAIVQKQKSGSGVILDGRFVLTVEHVVVQDKYTVDSPLGEIQVPAEKVSEETYFEWKGEKVLLRPVYKNPDEDVALLEIVSDVRPPSFPYQIGNSDELKVGNFVYVVGNPLSTGMNVREGIVSATKSPSGLTVVGVNPSHTFMVSNGLMPGDSGSPIIAVRDGRYELVGISQGTITGNTRLSWGIRVNVIRGLLHTAHAVPEDKWQMPKKVLASIQTP
jgi:S1-C subfamily serine protease